MSYHGSDKIELTYILSNNVIKIKLNSVTVVNTLFDMQPISGSLLRQLTVTIAGS